MMKVLISGVAGFIGSSLARGLLEAGAEVRGIDNLSTGSMANLEEIRSQIDFRRADILDTAALADACEDVDCIFHQAAIPSVPISIKDPAGTNRVNLEGTLHVLEAARKARVRRVVYAASSAAYGDAETLPKTEALLPEPVSPYAVQKLAGEHYLSAYGRIFGLETVSLRYFNIFGPRQDPSSPYSGVLARFITQMLEDEPPTIFGNGETSRDFTFVDNVVHANLLAWQASRDKVAGRVFNIATGRRVTLNEACRALRGITGYRGPVNYAPERTADIRHSVADISAARAAFGYQVRTEFETGLAHTVAWYRAIAPEERVAMTQ